MSCIPSATLTFDVSIGELLAKAKESGQRTIQTKRMRHFWKNQSWIDRLIAIICDEDESNTETDIFVWTDQDFRWRLECVMDKNDGNTIYSLRIKVNSDRITFCDETITCNNDNRHTIYELMHVLDGSSN